MFTPVETTIGAVLLHQATSNLLYQNGNVLGASGLLRRLFTAPTKETFALFAGMAASFVPASLLVPEPLTHFPPAPNSLPSALVTVAVAMLIGWGSKASNGCTSGHMLCGLSRLSSRSAAAVAIFFPSAILAHHMAHPTLYTTVCPGTTPCYMPVFPSLRTTACLLVLASTTILAARFAPDIVADLTSSYTISSADATPTTTTTTTTITTTTTSKTPPLTTTPYAPARETTQFFTGLLFALGLQISQMSHPAKVASFLSFPTLHAWDPSLALVLVFAVLPNALLVRAKGFDAPPRFAPAFELPTKGLRDVDATFVAGAAAFGVGWGLSGTCPGPAVLRAFVQPVWGLLWMGGFWAGGRLVPG